MGELSVITLRPIRMRLEVSADVAIEAQKISDPRIGGSSAFGPLGTLFTSRGDVGNPVGLIGLKRMEERGIPPLKAAL